MTEKIPERILTEQARFLNNPVLKLIQDAAIFINLEGIVLSYNSSAEKILQISKEKILQSSFWLHLPDTYFGFSLRDALLFGLSHRLFYRSYSTKELEITTDFVRNGPSYEQGLWIVFRDISDKVQIQSLRIKSNKLEKLGEMLACTTHEIRNPLGGIQGYASLLYRDLKDQSHLREMAGWILEGTKALEGLVHNLLHYVRPVQISVTSIEVGPLLRQFIQFIKVDPMCPKNLSWQIHIPDEPIIAPIDRNAFYSVLFNLTYNALQAMPLGGTLSFSLLKIDSCYQMTISDTGIGMSEEQVAKLFSPHFTTKKHGNGLGLLEVQKIVQGHFGTIDVRSSPQQGTSFTLTFPLKRGV